MKRLNIHTDKSYRFSFQGQESDDEIKRTGNSINYKYRMHDPRVGRFFTVDPLAKKYPHNSPFAFSENKVIHAIELEGLEAWEVKNYWNKKFIRKYRAEIKAVTDRYIENGTKFTCEDLALDILINFSRRNQLPLTLKNQGYTGVETLNQEDYDDFTSFYSDVLENSAANDIALNGKKVGSGEEGLKNSQTGQIILLGEGERGASGDYTHTQIVLENSSSENGKIHVRQGNTQNHQGMVVESGNWNVMKKIWYNAKNQSIRPLSRYKPLDIFEWDFQMFNNNSKSTNGHGNIGDGGDIIDSEIEKPENNSNDENKG